MKVLAEELNIITAALHIAEDWFRVVAKASMEQGRGREANQHTNSSIQCELLAARIEKRRADGTFTLSEPEYRLICAMLDLDASLGMEAAQGIRAAGGPDANVSAQEKEIFATACRTIKDKWDRLGYRRLLN